MKDKSLIISKLMGGGRTALLIVTISLSAMLCACSEDEPPQPTAKPAEPQEWTDTLIQYQSPLTTHCSTTAMPS